MTADAASAYEDVADESKVPITRSLVSPAGRLVQLDGVEYRFHVRERDNQVAVVMSQPGWASLTGHDYWYISVEHLVRNVWRHAWTHPAGVQHHVASRLAAERYDLEASNPASE